MTRTVVHTPRRLALLAALLCLAAVSTISAQEILSSPETRARFRAMLERPRVPLAPSVQTETLEGFAVERGRFHSEAGVTVPFLVYKRADAKGRLPAVLVLHGTGGRKEGMGSVLKALANRGLLAVAIDARFHGERIPGGAQGSKEYQEAIVRAWREKDPKRQTYPLYYDTVHDIWRTVDYLQSRRDVDGGRIGILGFSMGGIQTWLAAAGDERLRVVVPVIAVQSFRWSLTNGQWQGRANSVAEVHKAAASDLGQPGVNAYVCRVLWNKVLPGILYEFDGPNMLRAIAPRPLLLIGSDNDPNCPIESARIAFAAAEDAYRKTGASGHLEIDVAPGIGHSVTPAQREKAYAWLEKWLKR